MHRTKDEEDAAKETVSIILDAADAAKLGDMLPACQLIAYGMNLMQRMTIACEATAQSHAIREHRERESRQGGSMRRTSSLPPYEVERVAGEEVKEGLKVKEG